MSARVWWYHQWAQHLGKYHINSHADHVWPNRRKNPHKTMMTMMNARPFVGDNIHNPPARTQAPSLQEPFSPSSNINQQAIFPETRNSLSKWKPSNTCASERSARTWVKNQAIRLRLRRGLIMEKWNLCNIQRMYFIKACHWYRT